MTDLVNGKIEEKRCRQSGNIEPNNLKNFVCFLDFFFFKSERHKFCWNIRNLEKNYTSSLLLWVAKQKHPKPPKSHHCLPEYFFKDVVLEPKAPCLIRGVYVLTEGYLWWHPQALGKLSLLWATLPAFFPAVGLCQLVQEIQSQIFWISARCFIKNS